MPDFLKEKVREIEERVLELKPARDEYYKLESALHALGGPPKDHETRTRSASPKRGSKSQRRKSGHKSASANATTSSSRRNSDKSSTSRRRGRPKGSGTRANQTLELVRAEPGITIPQLADKMGIKQNYLYRVLPGLAQAGLVEKKDKGWHPKATTA